MESRSRFDFTDSRGWPLLPDAFRFVRGCVLGCRMLQNTDGSAVLGHWILVNGQALEVLGGELLARTPMVASSGDGTRGRSLALIADIR